MKKKYEKPILQELKISGLRGEGITPLGFCLPGPNASGSCSDGEGASGASDCSDGPSPSVDCTGGGAILACSAGTSA